MLRRLVVVAIVLSAAAVSQAQERQTFVLNPGWNLVTFQVLPGRQAVDVFSSMTATDGSDARLFDVENPAGSRLKAALALDSVEQDGDETRFTWRVLEEAQYSDPGVLPDGFPLPDLDVGHTHARAGSPLREVAFGDAYLILVQGVRRNAGFEISGDELSAGAGLELGAGWNLVGFSFDLTASESPRINLPSFFLTGHLETIERVAGLDAANGVYASYFPREPEQSRLQFVEPSLGYWVRARDPIVLDPRLVVQVPGDADLPPLQNVEPQPGVAWNPGPEDLESSPPSVESVFHTAAMQPWIRIPRYEVTLRLPLHNSGGGAVGWTAVVEPFSGEAPAGTVALDSEAAVEDVFSLSAQRGLVVAETQVIEVSVNRTRLAPATYLADLVVSPSVGEERRLTLVVESGGLDGQWAGMVTIDTVNGRRNPVPDIDVHLHISTDRLDGSRLLRGFIDSYETVLWPDDASFVGQILEPRRSPGWREDYRTRFVLEGGVTLAPGDVNRFPYDSFPADAEARTGTDAETGLPFRTNAEGDRYYHTLRQQPDFSNPTPSFMSRSFQFLGEAAPIDRDPSTPGVVAPTGNAPVISGRYVETVTGLLNEPVRLEGRFELRRVSASPYARRPVTRFHDASAPLVRPRDVDVEADITVAAEDDVLIDRVLVVVAQTADGDRHRLTLEAPDGTEITLHDGQAVESAQRVVFDSSALPIDVRGLLDPPSIRRPRSAGAAPRFEAELSENLAGYVVRPPREPLDALRGRRGAGDWRLSWTHSHDDDRSFGGWGLMLFGPPIARLTGRVEVRGGPGEPVAVGALSDVQLGVVGLPATLEGPLIQLDRTTGIFTIDYVPRTRVDLMASKPGFAQGHIAGLNDLDPPHARGFRDRLDGFLAGGPGSDGLTVSLAPAGPPRVRSSVEHVVAASTRGTVTVENVRLSLFGALPAGARLRWDPGWTGASSAPAPAPDAAAPAGRTVTVDLSFPADLFTADNDFTVAVRPRVLITTDGEPDRYAVLPRPMTVTLADPPSAPPYRLVHGEPVAGFGAHDLGYAAGADATAMQAQKTTTALVDLDRVPRIAPGSNPALNFDEDGIAGEDVDLHPRTFQRPPQSDDGYQYLVIVPTPDGRFDRVEPSGPSRAYSDAEGGVEGREIRMTGEPVAIHSTIGGQIVNLGTSGTDGEYRIWGGVAPGMDP